MRSSSKSLSLPHDSQPIAVTGLGCRFPGAEGPDAFWRLLREGIDAVGDLPDDRYDVDAFYDPTPGTPGKSYVRHGGYLKRIDHFDAGFFGIAPREAKAMDPQQRMLLELSWEAIEDAGLAKQALAGSRTGVFIGLWISDFDDLLSLHPEQLDLYAVTGGGRFSASGHISHFFGLEGPSLVVDTACSSSLVAIHLACQSLRSGESEMALAGGANLIVHPQATISMCRSKMLSPDGRCKFGDASADGFGRSDGGGLVVLKMLDQALADRDPIYAVIRGSVANNNGKTSGQMVVPSGRNQAAAVRQACRQAGFSPGDLDYVEAHGTGTPVGDPIELGALGSVLGEGREDGRPCLVGSVKTNIGHTEGAAGVAGLIKLALSLKHRQIPPSLLVEGPNPDVPWQELGLEVPRELTRWPDRGMPARAGVSGTGLSGTNVHVVLEQAPVTEASAEEATSGSAELRDLAQVLTLSAQTPAALEAVAEKYVAWLGVGSEAAALSLSEICATASVRRTHLDHRLTVVGHDRDEVCALLEAFCAGEARPGMAMGRADTAQVSKVVFVFPGQGSQWLGMGRELRSTEPVFRQALERCDAAVREHVGWSLLEELDASEDASRLDEMDVVQPMLFAVEVALAALWRSWGVEPDAVVGHSMGEVAAAHVAGALDLDDAARIICRRSRLLKRQSGKGAMFLVELTMERAREALRGHEDRVSIAVSNSPSSTVLAGDPEALGEIVERLEHEHVFCRPVKVSVAAHSPQIDPLMPELHDILEGLEPTVATVPFFSTVEARTCDGSELDADYWARNLRQPVLFAAAMEQLIADDHTYFVEMSPHPILLAAVKEMLQLSGREGLALASLRREEAERASLLGALGALHVRGHGVDWARLHPPGIPSTRLPAYPWQREAFWLDAPGERGRASTLLGAGLATGHPLLGEVRTSAAETSLFFWDLDLTSPRAEFLGDHCLRDGALLPAAGYLEMAIAAAEEVLGPGNHQVSEVSFDSALFLDPERPPQVQLVVSHEGGDRATFKFFGRPSEQEPWTVHATGMLRLVPEIGERTRVERENLAPESYENTVLGDDAYGALAARGYLYGPAFQGLRQVWWNGGETHGTSLGHLGKASEMGWETGAYKVHPALLDAALQSVLAGRSGAATFVPVAIADVGLERRHEPDAELWSLTRLRQGEAENVLLGDVSIVDDLGRRLLEVRGLELQAMDLPDAAPRDPDQWLYEIRWHESPPVEEEAAESAGRWLLLSDRGGVGEALRAQLLARGGECLTAFPGEGFSVVEEGVWEVDPGDPEAMRRLLAEVSGTGGVRGVVHLWSLAMEVPDDAPVSALVEAERLGCVSALHLIQGLVAIDARPPRLCLVTGGGQALAEEVPKVAQALLVGLGRVVANEHPELGCKRVDLSAAPPLEEISVLCDELFAAGGDEIAVRDRRRFEPSLERYAAAPAAEDERQSVRAEEVPFRLDMPRAGVLDDLRLRPVPRRPPGAGEIEIRVATAGLNFRNVLMALGEIEDVADDSALGQECAGTVTAVGAGVDGFEIGDEVVAVAPFAFASYTLANAQNSFPKPAHMSFEEAVSMTIVLTTAYYALVDLARLKAGERVLIHCATGGVGLAAVRIARAIGAEIFASAGTPEKREYLRALGIEHVTDSRTTDFVDEILEATGGAGVDVVLNSLAGEGIRKGLDALAPYGRFLELGKIDFLKNRHLGLGPFLMNLSFHGIDLNHMWQARPELFSDIFQRAMSFCQDHQIEPLPLTTFSIGEVAEAFRYMAQARHIGKIVLRIEGEEVALDPSLQTAALRSDATYLVTGGLGGVGLELAGWMVGRGARHLVLLGRSDASDEAREKIARLSTSGARIVTARADVSRIDELRDVFSRIEETMPPLAGVVHGAMVLDDGILRQLDRERFARVMAPKVHGAWNLHLLSRELPLDHFVLFSSAALLLGSPGQGNYVAANAFLDALAHYRRAVGLPAMSVDWGPWARVGAAARPDRGGRLALRGMESFEPEEGLEVLGRLLVQDVAQVGVVPVNWRRWKEFNPAAANSSLFARLVASAGGAEQEDGIETGLLDRLRAAAPDERLAILESFLQQTVAQVMGFSSAKVDPQLALNRLGIDSLMAVELRNRIERDTSVAVSVPKILSGLTVSQLTVELRDQMVAGQLFEQVDELSDEDVDSLLRQMLSTQG